MIVRSRKGSGRPLNSRSQAQVLEFNEKCGTQLKRHSAQHSIQCRYVESLIGYGHAGFRSAKCRYAVRHVLSITDC